MQEEPKQEVVEHVEAMAVTHNALEQMERASIDIQITTAKNYPRSMAKFKKRAEEMITMDEETAASCLYRRPVGKEGGKMKYAEGESIRLAEIVASSYGNIRVAGMIVEMEPRHVKAVGVAHDLETNVAYKAEVIESTVNKYGQPFSERMRVVVAKAAQSKAIRDAIFRVCPKSLCKNLIEKAKIVACGDEKTFSKRRDGVMAWIKSLKIDEKRVWNALGIDGKEDITYDVLLQLTGLKTALDENDCTIDEAFPKLEQEESKGSVTDRIKDRFDPKSDAKKETKKTDSKTTKAKADVKKEPDPEELPEDFDKTVADMDTKAKVEEQKKKLQEPVATAKPKFVCERCERESDTGGKCGSCFGLMLEIK